MKGLFIFGERKYASLPSGAEIRVELDGYAEGSYTLSFKEIFKEETVSSAVFAHLPTSVQTTASLTIPEEGVRSIGVLEGDYNGEAEGGTYTAETEKSGESSNGRVQVSLSGDMQDEDKDDEDGDENEKEKNKATEKDVNVKEALPDRQFETLLASLHKDMPEIAPDEEKKEYVSDNSEESGKVENTQEKRRHIVEYIVWSVVASLIVWLVITRRNTLKKWYTKMRKK